MDSDLLFVGASVRAAAFSAMRAGLRPWAIDLFADRDLAAKCPAKAVPPGQYPAALVEMAREAPPGPWLYTGALENWPELVEQIGRDRPLWGNDAACLRRIRDPFALADAINAAGLPCPAVRRARQGMPAGRWLIKPLASAGGYGIRVVAASSGSLRDPARLSYLQEYVEGESRAGIFVAERDGCRLLGVTRQLVGEKWLHARRFRYAGSIGPSSLSQLERDGWDRVGSAISRFAELRGIFGIDAVMRDGVPWPVEVNPRYTASEEETEFATGLHGMDLNRRAFEGSNVHRPVANDKGQRTKDIVGKAVWYAPRTITVPANGPWENVFSPPTINEEPPPFADIPAPGQRIAAGHPVLTMFATGVDPFECERRLRTTARELDAILLR